MLNEAAPLKRFLVGHHRVLFYSTWLVLGLLQASFTELMDDEAYYWMYSRYPAFGYYEHPPVIAIMIRAGYSIFQNELGVRFFTVLFNTATIYLLQKLLYRQNDLLFYAIVVSISLSQLGGFIAVPDSPMMFFAVLFFLVYRSFTNEMNRVNTLLLGVVAALLLYSKYHGILILFFTLLSNPKLLLKRQAWFAGITSLVLFMPHLFWQWTNDFPSLKFHLGDRFTDHYKLSFSVNYIVGQVLAAGPLMGWLLLWVAFRHKPVSVTERALKFTLVGTYLFFLAVSFRYNIETNWPIAAFVGLIILGHQELDRQQLKRRWLYISVPFTLLLVFANRAFLVLDDAFSRKMSKAEFHGNKSAAQEVENRIDKLPLVIINSYQKASKYRFYTGNSSFALNTVNYHRNSFNFWPVEDSLIGKSVYVIGKQNSLLHEPLNLPLFPEAGGVKIDDFYSFSLVHFNNVQCQNLDNEVLEVSFTIKSPPHYISFFAGKKYDSAGIYIALYNADNEITAYQKCPLTLKEINQPVLFKRIFFSSFPRGNYHARMVVSSCLPGVPTLNSNRFIIKTRD